MATTTSLPVPEAPKSINHFARIFGALFSPKKTFAQIAERPSWLAPVLLMAILATAVGAMLQFIFVLSMEPTAVERIAMSKPGANQLGRSAICANVFLGLKRAPKIRAK